MTFKTTIVTHTLKSEWKNSSTVNINMREKLLKIDLPMVIFSDSFNVLNVWKIRAKYNLLHLTYIYQIEFKELPFAKHIDTIYDMRNSQNLDIMSKMTYKDMILGNSKSYFVNMAKHKNPFNSNNFLWIDIDLFDMRYIRKSEISAISEIVKISDYDPGKKIHICCSTEISTSETINRLIYCLKTDIKIYGKLIFGSSESWLKLDKLITSEFYKSVENKYIPIYYNIFEIVTIINRDNFRLYYGGEKDIIDNFLVHKHNISKLFEIIRYCKKKNLDGDLIPCIDYLLTRHMNSELKLNRKQLTSIYDYLEVYKDDISSKNKTILEFYLDKDLGENGLIKGINNTFNSINFEKISDELIAINDKKTHIPKNPSLDDTTVVTFYYNI